MESNQEVDEEEQIIIESNESMKTMIVNAIKANNFSPVPKK